MSMTNSTIHSIAGYCNERALWKLLVDLSADNTKDGVKEWKVLMPGLVIVDGEDFRIGEISSSNPDPEFFPPEGVDNYGESGFVWSLGALICYASSGHYVFGGQGGVYQRSHPQVELPTLKKEFSALSPVVKRCLCYTPSQRVSIKELHTIAIKGLDTNEKKGRVKRAKELSGTIIPSDSQDDIWPEKME